MIISITGTDESRNGAISAVTALSAVSAVKFSQKTLVLPLFNAKESVDIMLNGVNIEKQDTSQDRDFKDTGIDGLMRRAVSSNVGQKHFNGLCSPMLKGQNMLDVAECSDKEDFDQESLKRIDSIKFLLKKANDFYNCVFVMADNNNKELKESLLDVADINIFCVKQGKIEKIDCKDKSKAIILVTGFNSESKFTLNSMKKAYKGYKLEVMPFNIEFRDSKYSENALSYFIKNESVETNNPNYDFITALSTIYENITENKSRDEDLSEEIENTENAEATISQDVLFQETLKINRVFEELVEMEEIPGNPIKKKKSFFG